MKLFDRPQFINSFLNGKVELPSLRGLMPGRRRGLFITLTDYFDRLPYE